jgi:hypothetical protein
MTPEVGSLVYGKYSYAGTYDVLCEDPNNGGIRLRGGVYAFLATTSVVTVAMMNTPRGQASWGDDSSDGPQNYMDPISSVRSKATILTCPS